MADQATKTAAKTALITGAASGIGKAIAVLMASKGWQVHVCDANADAIAALQNEHPELHAQTCNVAEGEKVREFVSGVVAASGGKIDLLVNNAGVSGMNAPVENIDDADWQRTLDVNVNGTFFFLKNVVPHMKKAGAGSIVNIASTAALFGYPNRTPYAAAKWAIVGITKTIAMELGPFGIRANAICPGSVEGPRIDGVIERDATQRGVSADEVRRIYQSQVSMRSFVTGEDIANMCAFLASDEARLVSGQIIAVDGHTESLSVPL